MNPLLDLGLMHWPEMRASLDDQVAAVSARTQDQLAQARLEFLDEQHPFLHDLWICRYGEKQVHGFQAAADQLAKDRYHSTAKAVCADLNAVLDYYWAIADVKDIEKTGHRDLAASRLRMQQTEDAMTPKQLEIAQRHLQDAACITGNYYKAGNLLNMNWDGKIRQQLIDEYWSQYGDQAKYQAGYALAKEGKNDPLLPMPVECIGFMGPSWEDGGITFRIEPRCFDTPSPLLYYQDDDRWSPDSWNGFLRLSSGLSEIRTDSGSDIPAAASTILFRPDPAAVKETFLNRGEVLYTKEIGGHLFVRCGTRDFHCEFGEIRNGEKILLAKFII